MSVFPFAQQGRQPFQFAPTLDGQVYTALVTWSLAGRRYYLNLYSLAGALVVANAMVGSPTGVDIESASWLRGRVSVETVVPHGFVVGTTIPLMITGMSPDAYNGTFQAFITGRSTFEYDVSSDPGVVTNLGSAVYNIDLVAGYFTTSVLVFRTASQQFEVFP